MIKIDSDQVEAGKAGDSKAMTEEIRFGAMFRAARESSSFTVERAAMATRISQPFIEALERDDFDKLPGAVFGRGFIRNLCKTYGKDPTEFLAAFDLKTNTAKGKDVAISHRDEKRHQQLKKGVLLIQPNEWKGRFKTLAPHHYLRAKPLALIVGGMLIVGFLVNQFNQGFGEGDKLAEVEKSPNQIEAKETSTPAPNTESKVTEAALGPATASPMPNETAPLTENAPQTTNPPVEQIASGKTDGMQELEIQVKMPVILKITKDADKQVSETLQPNTYQYRFKDQLKLYVDDVSAVDIYFQGKKIPSSGVKGESRRLSFQASEPQVAKKPTQPQL